MSVINTNITSMIGQQNLRESQNALQTSMERLSSGLRINSAKDDAAGQAIANRMSAQINGLAQAQRNANDGISIAQTAEGGLNQVNDNLQRVRELTVQAQNGTNSQDDLTSIQDEINQRLSEIDRISQETDFNGTKVLANNEDLTIQVGADDGQTISVGLQEITSTSLKLSSFNVNGPQDTNTATAALDLIQQKGSTTAAMKEAYGETTDISNATVAETNGTLKASLGITAGSATIASSDVYVDDAGNWFAKASIKSGSAAETNLLASQGIDANSTTATEYYIALEPGEADLSGANVAAFSIDIGNFETSDLTSGQSGNPMEQLDEALKTVDSFRSELGAVQNRFESAITNLSTNQTNLSAARSRIEDADYAMEVADMTKNQILQQAGTSVLAQANQLPQGVLSLLG